MSGSRLRFHLDEMVDPDFALALRRHGIDVTTTLEVGLRTQPDEAHVDFARREQRVIVTHDADYLIMSTRGVEHPGIAYCAVGSRSIGQITSHLILMYEVLAPPEMANTMEYI